MMTNLRQKLANLTKLLGDRYLRENLHLRPVSVADASSSGGGVVYHTVYADYRNSMDIDDQLYAQLIESARPAQRSFHLDYRVVEIPQGRVFAANTATVAVINQENELLGDVSFSYRRCAVVPAQDNLIFKQARFPEPVHYPGTLFTLLTGGGGGGNYAHWLIDAVPRLHLLIECGLFDSVDSFLVPTLKHDFQLESLKLLGIPEHKIVEGPIGCHISADRLIASTAPRGDSVIIPAWVTDFYRKQLLDKVELPQLNAPYVYVRRSDSGIRNVDHEDALVARLEAAGFQSFELMRLSFIEKVALFAQAKVVTSVHGAGLTNVMFCRPECQFVELFPDQFVLTTYADLAANIGMPYRYMICPSSGKADNLKAAQRVDVSVDFDRYLELLSQARKQAESF